MTRKTPWTVWDGPACSCPVDLAIPIDSFTYSSSNRYGLSVVEPDHETLHEMLIRILDFFTGQLLSYEMEFQATGWLINCYWITEDRFVLIEFKKKDSTIRQYFMQCDHQKKTVDLEFNYIFRAGSFQHRAFTTSSAMPWRMGSSFLTLGDGKYMVASNSEQLVLMPFDNLVDTSIPKLRTIFKAAEFGDYKIKNVPFAFGTRINFLLVKHDVAKNGDRRRRIYCDRMISFDLADQDLLEGPIQILDNDPRLIVVPFKKSSVKDMCVPVTATLWQEGQYLILTNKEDESIPNRIPKTTKVYVMDLKNLGARRFKVPNVEEKSTFVSIYRTYTINLLFWKHKNPQLQEDFAETPLKVQRIRLLQTSSPPTLVELCTEYIVFAKSREVVPAVFENVMFP